ncbi:hypothetical protein LGR54_20805 [Ancylobacter sp. Lp-2]|uniref:hypothetical protein n=1 Tax=Ancylobacter sp. Lp-2 TaxID=2881339 RepID=UPI001E3658D8|nr:hypothetical protein [Ancylobacter sp. Lp-2]MCB4771054.1 hypothetical protein [Ancylobacter sp. Lp-2]
MSVALGVPAARKSDADSRSGYIGPAEAAYREEVRKAQARDAALNAFRPLPGEASKSDPEHVVRSSNGRQSMMGGAMLDQISGTPTMARKAEALDAKGLHSAARAKADILPPDALRLFDLVLRTDDAHRGAQLISLPATDIAHALGIPESAAQAARDELERRDLLRFFDDFSGNRGFRPAPSI